MNHSMIHVSFAPNGTVTNIGELPADANPQTWFIFLTREAGTAYEALANGRGVFRLTPENLTDLSKTFSARVA